MSITNRGTGGYTRLLTMQSRHGRRDAFVFDVDGTLACRNDTRGPFDFSQCIEDNVNEAVKNVLLALYPFFKIIILSARGDDHRNMTEWWLRTHEIPYNELHLRTAGDQRADHIVKWELYQIHIDPFFNVMAIFDDRNGVVDMWRSHGLQCFQVADGDF